MAKAKSQQTEVHEYQAEMQRLLDILVHSLYTDRDIFLRELVSNASDALSKVQLMTLTEEVLDQDAPLLRRIVRRFEGGLGGLLEDLRRGGAGPK